MSQIGSKHVQVDIEEDKFGVPCIYLDPENPIKALEIGIQALRLKQADDRYANNVAWVILRLCAGFEEAMKQLRSAGTIEQYIDLEKSEARDLVAIDPSKPVISPPGAGFFSMGAHAFLIPVEDVQKEINRQLGETGKVELPDMYDEYLKICVYRESCKTNESKSPSRPSSHDGSGVVEVKKKPCNPGGSGPSRQDPVAVIRTRISEKLNCDPSKLNFITQISADVTPVSHYGRPDYHTMWIVLYTGDKNDLLSINPDSNVKSVHFMKVEDALAQNSRLDVFRSMPNQKPSSVVTSIRSSFTYAVHKYIEEGSWPNNAHVITKKAEDVKGMSFEYQKTLYDFSDFPNFWYDRAMKLEKEALALAKKQQQ